MASLIRLSQRARFFRAAIDFGRWLIASGFWAHLGFGCRARVGVYSLGVPGLGWIEIEYGIGLCTQKAQHANYIELTGIDVILTQKA